MARQSRVHYSSSGGGDVGSISAWFRQKLDNVQEGTADAIETFARDGAETAKHLIATRGTFRSGKRGRIESGYMIDSVRSSFNPLTKSGNASGRFGWLQNRELYFQFQEAGFEHTSGIDVEGMYAMLDAYEIVRAEFDRNVSKAVRNA